MEKERFLDLARNFTSLTEAETRDLDELQKQFPYSQVIHNLASRGAQDHQLESSRRLLNISAVYSTDRGVLKTIITAPRTERTHSQESTPAVVVTPTESKEETPVAVVTDETGKPQADQNDGLPELVIDHQPSSLSGEALNEEIMSDLNRLKELKHNFEVTVEEFEHSKNSGKATPKVSAKSKESKATRTDQKKNDLTDVSGEPSAEGLLEEIKSKRKFTPESQKQKDQIDIIDQFIKKQPSIPKPGTVAPDASDLAEKNLSLTDNIVSETLVEILLKQGKKDKAIEVLKKLIWKFPQKKAIFAAQIEELKK